MRKFSIAWLGSASGYDRSRHPTDKESPRRGPVVVLTEERIADRQFMQIDFRNVILCSLRLYMTLTQVASNA